MLFSTDIIKLCKKTDSFIKETLALWASVGYDTKNGGYFEALDFNANPLVTRNKRFRIHGRNMFAHAAGTRWGYYDGLEISEQALEFMTQKCLTPQKGFVSLTSPEGKHIDTHMRSYEHSFTLLGLGWLSYVSGKTEHKQWLDKTFDTVLSLFLKDDNTLRVSVPDDGTPQQQNPHMHTFEAMISLYNLFKKEKYILMAQKIYKIFETYFCKKEEKFIREFFTDDWQPDKKRGNFVDPGHHFEWTWLLHQYGKITGEYSPLIPYIYKFGEDYGVDSHGLGYDEIYADGSMYRDTHRLWVQTEVLKAHLAMSECAQTDKEKHDFLTKADNALENLFSYYFLENGLWYDQLDKNLQNISNDAPASTLYHIVIALHEYLTIRGAS